MSNKEVKIWWKYEGEIVEIQFIMGFGKTWFSTNMTPALEFIKKAIPATAHTFDPVTKHWEFAKEYWLPVNTYLEATNWKISDCTTTQSNEPDLSHIKVDKEYEEKFYHEQQVISTQESKETVSQKLAEFFNLKYEAFLELSKDNNSIKRLYRQEAMRLHPDRNNGDGSQMSELNRLWSIYNT